MSDYSKAWKSEETAGRKRWQKIMDLPGSTEFQDLSTGIRYRRDQFIPVPHREKVGECEVFKIFDQVEEVCVGFLRLTADIQKGGRCSLSTKSSG